MDVQHVSYIFYKLLLPIVCNSVVVKVHTYCVTYRRNVSLWRQNCRRQNNCLTPPQKKVESPSTQRTKDPILLDKNIYSNPIKVTQTLNPKLTIHKQTIIAFCQKKYQLLSLLLFNNQQAPPSPPPQTWKKAPLRNVQRRRESSAQICRQKRKCAFRSNTTKLKRKGRKKKKIVKGKG